MPQVPLQGREKSFLSCSPFLKSFTSLPWDSGSPFKSSEARAYPKRSFIRAGRNGFSCLLYLPKARKAASLFNSCPVQSILVRVPSRDKPTGKESKLVQQVYFSIPFSTGGELKLICCQLY